MRIAGVEATDLFVGTAQRPLQVIRVRLVNEGPGMLATPVLSATVRVNGPGVRDQGPFGITGLNQGEERAFEVPVEVTAPYQPGGTRRVTVTVDSEAGQAHLDADITVAEPGWTMWMVSHFHYDPIWWNTQGQFTEARLSLPDEDGALPDVRTAFELVGAHLDKARKDPDYKFVLAEVDYLKPYFDAYPQDRADLRALVADGRVEIVGGNYNEPNTNLTGAESTIRNAVYGIGFQRDVFGGDPQSAWMLDVFAHDPGYPGLMAAAGLTSSAWARGPFHQWGPAGAPGGGNRRMQFASEFEWLSPDGQGLLTSYMAHHYGAGWKLQTLPDLGSAELEAYRQFRALAQVAATRNVLLPVGADHVIPARWVTDVHRDWNQRYVWPRFTTAIPAEFFAAVKAEASSQHGTGAWITPQTRDMGPVYTGKDVSYIDTKQAQRAIETAVTEAERLATMAWLDGAPFPHVALDRAWRLLAYGAHHDAITGVESDQVYLDLAAGWREAWELGCAARRDAADRLTGRPSGPGDSGDPGDPGRRGRRGLTVSVVNGLARARDGLARVTVQVPADGTRWLEARNASGEPVRALAEGVRRRPDGSLAEVTLTLSVDEVPALGFRRYQLTPADPSASSAGPWREDTAAPDHNTIENGRYVVTADPSRGGTVSVLDKRTRTAVLAGPGNELVIQDEYAQHPRHGEGPWHLAPKGPGQGSSSVAAQVRRERCPAGVRLVASFALDGLDVTQETILWHHAERVEFRTHIDGYRDRDRLLRVRFPADVPGGLPLYQTATAVIGRSFGASDVDSADHWYTLDSPAHQWFGLGSTARARTADHGEQAIGVAEVVCADMPNGFRSVIRDLMIALAAAGVTATCSQAAGPRYGGIDADSNLPDTRICLGGPEVNGFTAEVLTAAGPGYAKALEARLAGGDGTARLWVPAARRREEAFGPDADVRGPTDLPVLIVAGTGPAELAAAVADLAEDLADALVEADRPGQAGEDDLGPGGPGAGDLDGGAPPPVPLADRSVAVLNRGTPGAVVTPDGTLHMSLMRSCSAWPSGIWIDGDPRTVPDGSSFAWQHWSHTFEYALASGPGDWRAAAYNLSAEDYNHDLIAVATGATGATRAGKLTVEPATVTLSAVKPRGNPLAAGRPGTLAGAADGPDGGPDGDRAVTVRLRETAGRVTTARVRLAAEISAAWLTDLLEETAGAPLAIEGSGDTGDSGDSSAVVVTLPPFGTVTLVVRTSAPAPAAVQPVPAAAQAPVHTRYWLHGKGPAPAGNLPVAVHLSPTRTAVPVPGDSVAGEPVTLTLTVGCGAEPASGTTELFVPEGITVVTDRDLTYDLAPGGYAAWDLTIRAVAGTAAGRYFVAARIRDELGQVIEDTAMVAVGEPRWPDPDLAPEDTIERLQDDYRAGMAEIDLAMVTPELRLAPGGQGELLVEVTNQLASELHGEAQLISPFGTWPLLGPWTQSFAAAPQASTTLRFAVHVPAAERPGSQWWALVKVMYFGRVRYTEAIAVIVPADDTGPGT
jgi:alpha-mannosidase